MSDIVYRIAIKNKHVYDCMKRSELSNEWLWESGNALAAWDPYRNAKLSPDAAITLFVHDDNAVTYSIAVNGHAVPWSQWAEKMKFLMNNCSDCKNFVMMKPLDLIGTCKCWHDSGRTWPKAYENACEMFK